ncbi:MAG: hypothetical protein ACI915_002072 [Gammaproteobacteria bacterium]|jgi:uncharacterized protein (DUF4415 family)
MTTARKSLDELKASPAELKKLLAMKDSDIDYSDIPELDAEFFATAEVVMPPEKKHLSIRIDADVLEWMKGQGKGYQSRINAILRAYYEAHRTNTP